MLLIWLGATATAAAVATTSPRGAGGHGDWRTEFEKIKKVRKDAREQRKTRELTEQDLILARLYERSRLDALEREAEEILLLFSS